MNRLLATSMTPILVAALPATAPALADTLAVPDQYQTIQAAIDASVDGDVVLVRDGTYTGAGNRDMDFGGRAITVRSENGAESCVIDLQADELDPHRAFDFHSGETADSIVDGFTIQNGFMSRGGAIDVSSSPLIRECVFERNGAASAGGAIHWFGYSGGPTFVECGFLENRAETAGGGAIMIETGCEAGCGGATFLDCQFTANTATGPQAYGGAILIDAGVGVTTAGCTFEGNRAYAGGAIGSVGVFSVISVSNSRFSENISTGGGGGAIQQIPGLARVEASSCRFTRNRAESSDGGAILGGFVILFNCAMQGNHADGVGGSLWVGRALLANTTMAGNTASAGGGIYFGQGGSGSRVISSSILWGNAPDEIAYVGSPTVTYSDIQGGWPGAGNIDADPLLIDPATGDFRLAPGSPCIDAGDNTALDKGVTTDLGGNPRFVDDPWLPDTGVLDARPPLDMGSYEHQADASAATAEGFTVLYGNYQGGSAEDLHLSDDAYVTIEQRAALSVLLPLVALEVDATAVADDPSVLTARIETAATSLPSQPPQKLRLYDWDLAAWELVDERTATLGDSPTAVMVTADAGRFIEPGTNALRMRIEWFDPGAVFSPAWGTRTDQAIWFVIGESRPLFFPDA